MAEAAIDELKRRKATRPSPGVMISQLTQALRGMLTAYAPRADETAAQTGEQSLQSDVQRARAVLRQYNL